MAMLIAATAVPLAVVEDEMDVGVEEVTVTSNGSSDPVIETKDVGDLVAEMLVKVSAAAADLEEIMILDDDEDENTNSSSLVKTNNSMDQNENDILNSDDKENISKTLKRLSRKDLEDLVLVKVVDAIVNHSQAGKLRSKVLELQTQKDKMFQRIGALQKQVQEMSKALKVLIDNHNRDPNGLNPNKRQKTPPIKFYRSVGLQVAIEPPFRNGPTKVIHVNDPPINGFKSINGAVYNAQSNQNSQKRIAKSSASTGQQSQPGNANAQSHVRILNGPKSRGPLGNSQQLPGILKTTNGQSGSVTNTTKSGTNNGSAPTVVDLTEDSSGVTQNSNSNVITASNGMQYRIINPSPQGVQIIQSNQSYQIVTSQANQGRQIVLSQNVTQGKPLQALTFRSVPSRPTAPTAVPQARPPMSQLRQTSPASTSSIPKVAATIGTMVRAPIQPLTPKKFMLPPLPPQCVVPIQRGRVLKDLPPRPSLTLSEQEDGIVLSWTLRLSAQHAVISSYQIYACQESLTTSPGKVSQWKKVGDVKALPLPMACTLSQFTQGNRYFFIVRGIDNDNRTGAFCEPAPIILHKKSV